MSYRYQGSFPPWPPASEGLTWIDPTVAQPTEKAAGAQAAGRVMLLIPWDVAVWRDPLQLKHSHPLAGWGVEEAPDL